MKINFLIGFLLINFFSFSQVRLDGFDTREKNSIESAISLIKEKDDFKYSRLLEFCKMIKYSDVGVCRIENDSIIIITKEILNLGSVNKVACSIIHETKRLEIKVKKYNLSKRKEEWTCYSSEWGFCCRINCEEWLKHEIQDAMIEWQ